MGNGDNIMVKGNYMPIIIISMANTREKTWNILRVDSYGYRQIMLMAIDMGSNWNMTKVDY